MVLSFILIQNRQFVSLSCEPCLNFPFLSISYLNPSVDQLTNNRSGQRQNPFSEMVLAVQREPSFPSDLLSLTLTLPGRREDKIKRRGMNLCAPSPHFVFTSTLLLPSNHSYRSTDSSRPETRSTNPTSLSSDPSRLFIGVTPGSSSAYASTPMTMSWPTWRRFTSL